MSSQRFLSKPKQVQKAFLIIRWVCLILVFLFAFNLNIIGACLSFSGIIITNRMEFYFNKKVIQNHNDYINDFNSKSRKFRRKTIRNLNK